MHAIIVSDLIVFNPTILSIAPKLYFAIWVKVVRFRNDQMAFVLNRMPDGFVVGNFRLIGASSGATIFFVLENLLHLSRLGQS